jgi:hypothetical protein
MAINSSSSTDEIVTLSALTQPDFPLNFSKADILYG